MKKIKVLVGHPGKQHSLKLAEAILNDSKYDFTSFYSDRAPQAITRPIKL